MKALVSNTVGSGSAAELLTHAEVIRSGAREALDRDTQAALGQFFTPVWMAELAASMIDVGGDEVSVLDPGAGAGVLFLALGAALLERESPPRSISVTAFELDQKLEPFLERSARALSKACHDRGVACEVHIRIEDFADWASRHQVGCLFTDAPLFDVAILNPPYTKLSSKSDLRGRLDAIGIAAPNLYAAFLGLSLGLLRPGGQLAAIVPRSFCNGTYFKRFRRFLFESGVPRRIHLFDARDKAFGQDSVLQENLILGLGRVPQLSETVELSFSEGGDSDPPWFRSMDLSEIIHPDDSDRYVHLPRDPWSSRLSATVRGLPSTLNDLGIEVSTGPVVDFRMAEDLRFSGRLGDAEVPLLYPQNLRGGRVSWPIEGKKPQALAVTDRTERDLLPAGYYVACRRFSSKEEKRRIVASVIAPQDLPSDRLALENHLNFFHRSGQTLDRDEAYGLATFLNSTMVDQYFRQFSGHTQVNATDLRKLRYPSEEDLRKTGRHCRAEPLWNDEADATLRSTCQELQDMPGRNHVEDRITQARAVLDALGLPAEQLNDRSALTLLALLSLRADDDWSEASAPLIGVTPIMEWAAEHYARRYAPNSRETFRRFTLHQFVEAGLVVANPDQPDRAVNSPKY